MSMTMMLLVSSVAVGPPGGERDAVSTESLCGPVALYVALKTLGVDPSIEAIAEECAWDPQRGTVFANLATALDRYGEVVEHRVVRVTKRQLESHLTDDGVAVLPLFRDGSKDRAADHAVCAVAVDDGIVVVEYPGGRRTLDEEEFGAEWRGEAILIRPVRSRENALAWGLAVVSVVFAVILGLSAGRERPRRFREVRSRRRRTQE